MALIERVRPAQCTLVPDLPGQLTSDHGWDVPTHEAQLAAVLEDLRGWKVRSSLFLDPEPGLVEHAAAVGADRIELYTEAYARAFGSPSEESVLESYRRTAARATALGIGVNAGHDLSLGNLARFLEIPAILEVSIGHALVVESLEWGVDRVVQRYLAITQG